MKNIFTITLTTIALIAVNAITDSDTTDQSELDRYIWFNTEGMYDVNVPNDEIHELITNGIQHENQEIIDCTIDAMAMHIGGTFEARKQGKEVDLNRDLRHKEEWYDTLINMWDDNWNGVFPEETVPDDFIERIEHNTGCHYTLPTWPALPQM